MAASVAEDTSLKVAVVRSVELSYGGLEGVIGHPTNGSAPRVPQSVHPGLLRTPNNELM